MTPAQVALELGVSSRDVRDVLRATHGTLSEQGGELNRWHLTAEQMQHVRNHFQGTGRNPLVWSLELGETVRRRELQETYGGSRQSGIVTSSVTTDILVFTDPVKGAKYGYDRHDGLHPDGTYTYTGQGQVGDQVFKFGNKALRDSAADGRVIRLFVSQGVDVTYEGAFTTADPSYAFAQIPDIDGNLRRGIVFTFIPLGERGDDLPVQGETKIAAEPSIVEWSPPEATDITVIAPDDLVLQDRMITRLEHDLQTVFGSWLQANGETPQTLKLPTSAGLIQPDMYVPGLDWVVEAKKSTGRAYVRMAIGQVLDYVHLARRSRLEAKPVILLPGRPEPDLKRLISNLGITLAVRTENGFDITEPD